jgi:hypothetical protein
MADDSLLNYRELIDELRRYCLERRTGSAMIATSENLLARLLLVEGAIQAVTVGGKEGRPALALLKGIKSGRIRFSDGKGGLQPDSSLPSAPEILLELGGTNRSPDVDRPRRSVDSNQLPTLLRAIENELIDVLGPMAGIVWTERLAKVEDITRTGAITKLVDDLAKEIGDPQKAKHFKERVWKILSA